jgi:hypothetical protein
MRRPGSPWILSAAIAVASLVVAAPASAQTGPGPPSSSPGSSVAPSAVPRDRTFDPGAPVLVTGTVLDGDLVPVPGAVVSLTAWGPQGLGPDATWGNTILGQTETAADGSFTVRLDPSSGAVAWLEQGIAGIRLAARVTRTDAGHVRELSGSRFLQVARAGVGWAAAPPVRLVIRQLVPDPSDPLLATGRVVDGDGVGVPGATIYASAMDREGGTSVSHDLAVVTATDDGSFTLRLRPDAYVRSLAGTDGRLLVHLIAATYPDDGSTQRFGRGGFEAALEGDAWQPQPGEQRIVLREIPDVGRPAPSSGR